MRPLLTSLFRVLVCATFVWVSPSGVGHAGMLQAAGGGSDCSDSIKNCKKPVKFISRDNSCYTFACEYGAPTQHNIHVSDPTEVKTLLEMAREQAR